MRNLPQLGLDALAILNNSPALTYVSAASGPPVLLFVSDAAQAMIGYPADRFVGNAGFLTSLVHPDDVESIGDCYRDALTYGSATRDRRLKVASGEWRWFRDNFRIVRDAVGGPAYGIGTIFDVTEEKQAQTALEARTAEYRILADRSSDLISRVTFDGRFIYQSPSAVRVMGFEPGARHGQSAMGQMHVDDVADIEAAWRTAYRTRQPQTFVYRAFHAEGRWVTLEAVMNPVVDAITGKVTEFVIVSRDVTDRVEAERRLAQAQGEIRSQSETYRLFAEHGSDFFLRLSLEGRMTHVSPSHERMLGRQPLIRDGRLAEVAHPDDVANMRSVWAAVIATRMGGTFRVRVRHELGHWVWIEATLTLITSVDAQPVEMIAVCRDVSQQVAAEDALKDATTTIKEQGELYDLFANRGSEIFLRFDIRGNALHVSPSHERILGRNTLVREGRVAHLVHPDDKARATEAFKTAFKSRMPVSYRHRYLHENGGWVWLEVNLTPLLTSDGGKVAEYIAAARDVTAQVEAEEHLADAQSQLAAAARRLRFLSDNSADAIVTVGHDGSIIHAAGGVEMIYGIRAEDLKGHGYDLSHPDDLPIVLEAATSFLETRAPVTFRARMRHAQNGWVWTEQRANPVFDPATGQLSACVVCIRNVEDTVRREEQLADARRDLDESRAQLRLVADNIVDVVTMVRPDGTVAYMSPSVGNMLGYTPNEMAGQSRTELVHPDDLELTVAEHARNRNGEVTPRMRYRVQRSDGAYIWVERRAGLVHDESLGEKAAILSVLRDVTADVERERQVADANLALEKSRKRLQLVTDNMQDVITLVRPDGSIAYMSPSAAKVAGYSANGELPSSDLIHPDDRAAMMAEFAANRLGRITPVMRYRIAHKDGRCVTVERRANAVTSHDFGEGTAVLSVLTDVSAQVEQERRIAETWQALDESRQRLQTIMDNSVDVIAVFSADRKLEYLSRSCEQQSGYRVEDFFEGRANLTHPEDEAIVADALARENAGRHGETFRYRGVRKDGAVIWLERRARKVYHGDRGAVRYIVTVTRDISEEVRHEREMTAANAALETARTAAEAASIAKSQFLATMSHELRTPMTGVMGMLDLLKGSHLDGEQARFARIAYESAENLLTILNDILDFSKIEAGQMKIEAAPFGLRGEVEKVCSLLAPVAHRRGTTLRTVLDDTLENRLMGDAARLRQVLFNLVGNAIKFTVEGLVSVSVRRVASGHVRFEVRDTGDGISTEAQAKLFRPFVQGDGSASRKAGGTGLGLAISKSLVQAMGGAIGLESAVGKGSLFWFEVPLRAVEYASTSLGPASPVTSPRRRFDILIAEDHPVNQQLIAALLKREGHTSTVVANGALAVEAVRKRAFDLVLMDVQMPVMDGTDATRAIRALPGPVARIPIIAITANALRGDMEAYLAAGMTHYVSKPIRIEALREAMESAVTVSGDESARASA